MAHMFIYIYRYVVQMWPCITPGAIACISQKSIELGDVEKVENEESAGAPRSTAPIVPTFPSCGLLANVTA